MRVFYRFVLIVAVVSLLALPASAQQFFQAVIDGAQEVPANASPASGIGCFTLNPDNTLDYEIVFAGLTAPEISAHIHGPAAVGVNAGVVFPFALGSPKIGTFGPLTAAQVADLSNGLYYVNIHTQNFPGGEIRGQIQTAAGPCAVPTEDKTWGAIKALFD